MSPHQYHNKALAAEDLLAAARHLIRQYDLRDGDLAPDQIATLRASVLRAESANRMATIIKEE